MMFAGIYLTVTFYPTARLSSDSTSEAIQVDYLELAMFIAVLMTVILVPTVVFPPLRVANDSIRKELTLIIDDVNKSSFGKKGKVTLSDPVYFSGCCQQIANYRVIEIEYGRY